MKNLINIIIKMAIIMGAAYLFPEYVACKDAKTLAMVVIVMIITGVALSILVLVATIGMVAIGWEFKALVMTIILSLASGVIQLVAAVHYATGFEIHGRMTYIILALLMGLLSVQGNTRRSE